MPTANNEIPEQKVCESCGEAFGCGGQLDGCWCVDLEIPPDAASGLKEKFNDCLCPKCLSSLAETSPRT